MKRISSRPLAAMILITFVLFACKAVAVAAEPDQENDTSGMTITASDDDMTESSCLDGITEYAETGPFSYERKTSGRVKMWVPDVSEGCKVPVIHFANGTGARCIAYAGILRHLASHGFLTTCYESTSTGNGTQCIEAVETAMEQYPDIADNKLGFTGHSQGGGAAFICTYRAEQQWGDEMSIAGHAIEPASGFGQAPMNWSSMYAQITSPMFMFNGSVDTLVSAFYVGMAFRRLSDDVEAYWYEAQGAAHIPIPTKWSKESAVAWFRWKLLGDSNACEYFKSMPDTFDWHFQNSKNETSCD